MPKAASDLASDRVTILRSTSTRGDGALAKAAPHHRLLTSKQLVKNDLANHQPAQ
jgi:hypothetical protein